MDALQISDSVLEWAAGRAGQSVQSLAELLVKRPKDRERVAAGRLTFSQLERIAKLIRVPVGLLFLDTPPEIETPSIPDLRQTAPHDPLSDDFEDVLADVLARQDWYRELLSENGHEKNPWVGKFPVRGTTAEAIAEDIRGALKLTDLDRASSKGAGPYFSLIAIRAENCGILVMKSGIVRANTHRPLSVREFRGFAIADAIAPVVFVNGVDAETAWCFTLCHELAHIWVGATGVSDLTLDASGIERLCNQVAAVVLAPEPSVRATWAAVGTVEGVAKHFRISRVATARRLFDLGLIDRDTYMHYAGMPYETRPPTSGQPSPWAAIQARNSKRFTRAIVNRAMAGSVMLRDAARLLNIKPDTVVSLSREL